MPHPLPPVPSRPSAHAIDRAHAPLPHSAEAAFDHFRLALHRKRKRLRADALLIDCRLAERKRPLPRASDGRAEQQ